jgi:hypothetical protein
MADDPRPETAEPELKDDELDPVAGGVIDGGCIPDWPWKPTPTFPPEPDLL